MEITLHHPIFAREVELPASKSVLHRQMIAAAFAGAPTRIALSAACEDVAATARCLNAIGVSVEEIDGGKALLVTPATQFNDNAVADCGESGSTLRFLLPVCAALGLTVTFLRRGRLPERPLEPLAGELRRNGVRIRENPDRSLTVSGQLQPGKFSIAANVSSQFITGLLFALSLLRHPSTLLLTGEPESTGYVSMTLATLAAFKAPPIAVANGMLYGVPGCLAQPFRSPGEIRPEADFSGAAFPLCAGAIGKNPVTVKGLSLESPQGDKEILWILDRFGAKIDVDRERSAVTVFPSKLKGIQIDARQIPDLVPVLAVVAAAAEGDTEITGAARLRLKESDRLATTAAMLRALGGDVEEREDGLLIHGGKPLAGGKVDGAKDHRIVMSAAVAALLCEGEVTVTDTEAVNKSFPAFFENVLASR